MSMQGRDAPYLLVFLGSVLLALLLAILIAYHGSAWPEWIRFGIGNIAGIFVLFGVGMLWRAFALFLEDC